MKSLLRCFFFALLELDKIGTVKLEAIECWGYIGGQNKIGIFKVVHILRQKILDT